MPSTISLPLGRLPSTLGRDDQFAAGIDRGLAAGDQHVARRRAVDETDALDLKHWLRCACAAAAISGSAKQLKTPPPLRVRASNSSRFSAPRPVR